ncbi:MAG: DNA-3-methyladenine glycosylase family protein [Candidatus Dormibacteria bacterium]
MIDYFRLVLRGAGGEPVDWHRLLQSHGVATLPPNRIDTDGWTLSTTVRLSAGAVVGVVLRQAGEAEVGVEADRPLPEERRRELLRVSRHLLRLDEDLSPFYQLTSEDPDLAWTAAGAGRMLRGQSVFEDLVKTICTTNCAWSATERMVAALVGHLGAEDGSGGHAFPTAEAMASMPLAFYQDRMRAGYRGPYLRSLAQAVARGELDLEELNQPTVSDSEAETRLLALPGVGPYAAAHVMLTSLGRYHRLILDSWTRPTFARLSGRKPSERAIHLRFRRYRRYQGLAFWLWLTRDWIEAEPPAGQMA